MNTTVFSLGGSIIAPDGVDTNFLSGFLKIIEERISRAGERFIIVCGGGGPARAYQAAYRAIAGNPEDDAQDWIGVAATRLNAALVKALFGNHCTSDVVCDPTGPFDFAGDVLIAAGWKPGFSSDFDAVLLAERFEAKTLINLSNIHKVYSDDPKTNPDAVPYDRLSWIAMRQLVGDTWVPGKNTPFDPVAARKASELGLRVIIAEGRNLDNIRAMLSGEDFDGTVIGPD